MGWGGAVEIETLNTPEFAVFIKNQLIFLYKC